MRERARDRPRPETESRPLQGARPRDGPDKKNGSEETKSEPSRKTMNQPVGHLKPACSSHAPLEKSKNRPREGRATHRSTASPGSDLSLSSPPWAPPRSSAVHELARITRRLFQPGWVRGVPLWTSTPHPVVFFLHGRAASYALSFFACIILNSLSVFRCRFHD